MISNLKTAPDSLHFFCNGITDKSQMFSWDSFDDSKVTKLAPECQVFRVNYGYMLTLLFFTYMKIWYSVTPISSIFQTSTHVWGKSINCFLVLGLNCRNCTFSDHLRSKSLFPFCTWHCSGGFCNWDLFCLFLSCFPEPLPWFRC